MLAASPQALHNLREVRQKLQCCQRALVVHSSDALNGSLYLLVLATRGGGPTSHPGAADGEFCLSLLVLDVGQQVEESWVVAADVVVEAGMPALDVVVGAYLELVDAPHGEREVAIHPGRLEVLS